MHPRDDETLAAIVGQTPDADKFMWCDECLRWEDSDYMKHKRPELCRKARFWDALYYFFLSIATWCSQQGGYAQAKHLVRTGRGRSPEV